MNWGLLQNSLLVSGLTTVLAVGMGWIAALAIFCLPPKWRYRGVLISVLALMLPPFLVTGIWLDLMGLKGDWSSFFPGGIYSVWGAVWIMALVTWPVTLVLVLGAWHRLEGTQLESDPALTGGALVRWLLLPQAAGALPQSLILTFVLALNNFAVPTILQVNVFTAEIWVSFNTTFQYGRTLQLCWPLILAPLLLIWLLRRRPIHWPHVAGQVPAWMFRRQLGGLWITGAGGFTALLLMLAVALPLGQLIGSSRTWVELPAAWASGSGDLLNSLVYSAGTAALCVGLGLATWRWPVGTIVWFPFLVPGVLLGIALIYLLNLEVLNFFYRSAGIVILALTIRYLAIGWHGTANARREVDPDLTDAARLDGAHLWQLWRYVYWPQTASQLAAVWYVVYLLCLWDVETLLLIVPAGGGTLSLTVFNLLHYGHNSQVNALCLLLLVAAVLPLLLWQGGRWCRARWKAPPLSASAPALALAPVLLLFGGCAPQSEENSALQSSIFSRVEVWGERGTSAGRFNKPRSVAVDRQDNVYVVDMTGRVQKFSPQGDYVKSWQMPETAKGNPKGMCRDTQGNIVVVEPHYARINHYTTEGELVVQWGDKGTDPGQIFFPRAVAIDSQGKLYVGEYGKVDRVQCFDGPGGDYLFGIGKAGRGPGEFNRPEGLALDGRDRLYVADSVNHRVQVFSPEGRFMRALGGPGTGRGRFNYPYDVLVDQAGRLFVCEFGNSRIQIFNPGGDLIEILGGVGTAPGQFNNPWSMAFDSKGNLYVADSMNHRVQKFIRS